MLRILTLTYKGKDKLQSLYPGLMNQLSDIDYKWYIKENGSNDGSIELIESWNNPNIIGINYPHNKDTFSYGCNFLFKESSPNDDDLILLLNNDIIFKDNKSLKNMISIIDKDSSVGVVGAKLLFEDLSIAHAGVVFSKFSNKLPMHYRSKEKDDKESCKNREFQAVTGAVLLTKAKYYKNICKNKDQLNGLDNELIWCFDDVSACLSIKYEMKKKIIYCGNTNIVHNESATLKTNPVNKLFSNHNVNYFKKKWDSVIVVDKELYQKSNKYLLYKGK